jgi:dUTP pyrophosphatase
MILHFKKLDEKAVLPQYATPGDNGLDLVALSKEWDEKYQTLTFGTGLAVEIPEGFSGLLLPRSSIYKTGLYLCNSIGLIDSSFRGEIKFKFYKAVTDTWVAARNYEISERIGQLILVQTPTLTPIFVDKLKPSLRDVGGFGSTGK